MIAIRLLGGLHITRDGEPAAQGCDAEALGLLAYLATEAGPPIDRAALAALFWPDQPDALARPYLERAVGQLRTALGAESPLEISDQAIGWRSGAEVDVAALLCLEHADSPGALLAAADRYGGEFLAGFALDGCPAFAAWQRSTRERLAQLARALRDRHLAYALALAEEAGPQLCAADAGAWLDRLEREHGHLRAALDWAFAAPDHPAALRLAAALAPFWYTRGHYAEGRQWLLQALAVSDAHQAIPARFRAINAAGAFLWTWVEHAAAARPLLQTVLARGDHHERGWAYLHLGAIAYRQHDIGEARWLLESGLAICRNQGLAGERGVAYSLMLLGDIVLAAGDHGAARGHYEDSLAILVAQGDPLLRAYPLRRLAQLDLERGWYDDARARCDASLRAAQAIGDPLATLASIAGFAATILAEALGAPPIQRNAWLRHAAWMCGAVRALLAPLGAPLWPADATALDACISALSLTLGVAAFAEAEALGRAAPLDTLLAQLAPPSVAHTQHNLPLRSTPLRGRGPDVAEVCRLLGDPAIRLLSLIGPGGVGKTGLSLEIASTLLADPASPFVDGVAFVDLSPISDSELVAGAIAQALSLRSVGAPALTLLNTYLRERRFLLVLDNFEQVVAAAPLIATLLAASPGLKVLVTSRQALQLRSEHLYLVQTLAVPPLQPLPALDALTAYPAMALLIERAQAAAPGFRLDATNAAALAAICARVDGLPLAIELAAPRLRLFPPTDLLARLDSSLRLLSGGMRDLPARQRAMRDTLSWSHALLSASAQQLFAYLSVFVGGFSAPAAEAVGPDPDTTLESLSELLNHSLIRQEAGAHGASRFRMLETIRAYALEQLQARGKMAAVRQRHARYFLSLAESSEPLLQGVDQTIWLDRLEGEHENLRAALEWALSSGASDTALRLAAALGEFWWPRGYLSEGRAWLDQALARSPAESPARAKALYRAGELAYGQNDLPRALDLLEAALALYRRAGDRAGIASVLRGLGNVRALRGDDAQAAADRAESLALFRAEANQWGMAWVLLEIGQSEPDHARKMDLLRQSLDLARAGGYQRTIATALGNLAKFESDRERARLFMSEALEIGRQLRDTWICAWTLHGLAGLADIEGDVARAALLEAEAKVLLAQVGYSEGDG